MFFRRIHRFIAAEREGGGMVASVSIFTTGESTAVASDMVDDAGERADWVEDEGEGASAAAGPSMPLVRASSRAARVWWAQYRSCW